MTHLKIRKTAYKWNIQSGTWYTLSVSDSTVVQIFVVETQAEDRFYDYIKHVVATLPLRVSF